MKKEFGDLLDQCYQSMMINHRKHVTVTVNRNPDVTMILIKGNIAHAHLILEHYDQVIKDFSEMEKSE